MTSFSPLHLLLLILALGGLPGSEAAAATATPADGAAWSAVLLRPGAAPMVVTGADLETEPFREAAADVEAVWLWSEACPPRRMAAADFVRRLEDGSIAVCGDAPGSVTVSVPGHDERSAAQVVAAPVAMWEEVPEALLPRWPVPDRGPLELNRWPLERWRLRHVGQDRGTWALDVPARQPTAALHPSDAPDLSLQAVGAASGDVLEEVVLTVFEGVQAAASPEVVSVHRAGADGLLRVPALPLDHPATFILGAPGHAPRAFRGPARDLPVRMVLPEAVSLRGRLLDSEGVPVTGVQVSAEGWMADDVPLTFNRRTTSGEDGTWRLVDVPRRPTLLSARREGFATMSRKLGMLPPQVEVDIGDVTLRKAVSLAVRVLDGDGEPVPGAAVSVERSPVSMAAADETGLARVEGLAAGRALEISASAPGFITRTVEVTVPWPEEVGVALTRGFSVRGSFIDSRGLPVVAGRVRIATGSRFRYEDLSPDGGFDLLLPPFADWSLELTSPSTRRLRVDGEAGQPGEVRELGELMAQPGMVVYGTLLSGIDGSPVAAARVWTPRATDSGGVLVSWLHEDVVEARSGEDGQFEIAGLRPGPTRLHVAAPGFAPLEFKVAPEGDSMEVDAGVVELMPGATVLVTVRGVEVEQEGLLAKLDLRGDWRPIDMVAAPVVDGRAELRNVPEGTARLLVEAGVDDLLCEKELTVEPGEDEVAVVCDARRDPVSGMVTVGGLNAGAGLLTWSRGEGREDTESVIYNRATPGGLRQQSVLGGGRPEVRVQVAEDGTFQSDRLSPGSWRVAWRPASGASAPPRTVDLPAGPVRDLHLAFPGHGLAGVVVDEEGLPVGRAIIRELSSGTFTVADTDGSFRMSGLEPGTLRLQARDESRYSRVLDLLLEEDRTPDPVRLEISRRHRNAVPVRVWTAAGSPGAGAMIFLEGEGQGRRLLATTDSQGEVEVTVPAPSPHRIRVAAHHEGQWVFGDWLDWETAREGVVLELARTGGMVVRSEEASQRVRLTTGGGWDLGQMLTRLGVPPRVSPDRPLTVTGLPGGTYTLELAATASGGNAGVVRVAVAPGRLEEVRLTPP